MNPIKYWKARKEPFFIITYIPPLGDVIVADDDFVEFLHDNGFDAKIEMKDLLVMLDDWSEE